MNNYEAATDYYCYSYIKYPKKFSWKAFNKFGLVEQQLLSEKYDIILTDYQTPKEKVMKIVKKFNIKNLNKSITKFNKQMSQFNTMMAPEKPQRTRKNRSKKEHREPKIKEPELNLWGSEKDFNKSVKDVLG